MISACATVTLHFIPPLFPFPPSSLSYQPPHSVIIPSSHLLSRPRSAPPSFSPLPPIVFPVFLLVCPALVCVSLSLFSTFPLFLLGGLEFYPRDSLSFPHQAALSLYRFLSFLSSVSFIPFRYAPAHCSRVSRIAEVKPSDDFLAGTWFRALLFSSLSLTVSFPCLLSS